MLEEEALQVYRTRIVVDFVTPEAIAAVSGPWQQSGLRKVRWDWGREILRTLRTSHPRRLELSIWKQGELCGLAVARVSDAKIWVSLTHVEGSPFPHHPLKGKIVPLALAGAGIFASLIADEDLSVFPHVRILRPDPSLQAWYAKNGYTRLHKGRGYTFATLGHQEEASHESRERTIFSEG